MPDTSPSSWPISEVPWPPRESLWRAELAKTEAETIFALGTADGTVTRIGSGADPRESWTRLQRASAAPLIVHDLHWAQGRFGLKLARVVQRVVGADVVDVAAYRRVLDAEAARLGIVLAGHETFLEAVKRDPELRHRRLVEKHHGPMTDRQYDDLCEEGRKDRLAFIRDVRLERRRRNRRLKNAPPPPPPNPYAPATRDLTRQTILEKRDPQLAAKLKAEAEAA